MLILSRFAGAAVECKRALLVNPYDVESVAGAMTQALTMSLEERRERHAALMTAITENSIDKWQKDFLDAISSEDGGLEEIQTAIQTRQGNLQQRPRTARISQMPAGR